MKSKGIPRCDCGGIIKPDVVLYEEGLDEQTIRGAVSAISRADVLIIGGTSLAVYPAAGFVNYFEGEHLILINRSATPYDREAEMAFHEDVIDVVSALQEMDGAREE